jgi:hypothetical protein
LKNITASTAPTREDQSPVEELVNLYTNIYVKINKEKIKTEPVH